MNTNVIQAEKEKTPTQLSFVINRMRDIKMFGMYTASTELYVSYSATKSKQARAMVHQVVHSTSGLII